MLNIVFQFSILGVCDHKLWCIFFHYWNKNDLRKTFFNKVISDCMKTLEV